MDFIRGYASLLEIIGVGFEDYFVLLNVVKVVHEVLDFHGFLETISRIIDDELISVKDDWGTILSVLGLKD